MSTVNSSRSFPIGETGEKEKRRKGKKENQQYPPSVRSLTNIRRLIHGAAFGDRHIPICNLYDRGACAKGHLTYDIPSCRFLGDTPAIDGPISWKLLDPDCPCCLSPEAIEAASLGSDQYPPVRCEGGLPCDHRAEVPRRHNLPSARVKGAEKTAPGAHVESLSVRRDQMRGLDCVAALPRPDDASIRGRDGIHEPIERRCEDAIADELRRRSDKSLELRLKLQLLSGDRDREQPPVPAGH